ncbi:MAG: molybdopterin-dependent oxidoreductase, partial [Caldilineaceae bacterium]|nr:molybdopterin-dependent oxidoreductase [Caldilineaceae bacterium]
MRTYFLRRLLHAIPLLIVLSVVLFLVVRAAPGGPLRLVVPRLYAWKSAKWLRSLTL